MHMKDQKGIDAISAIKLIIRRANVRVSKYAFYAVQKDTFKVNALILFMVKKNRMIKEKGAKTGIMNQTEGEDIKKTIIEKEITHEIGREDGETVLSLFTII